MKTLPVILISIYLFTSCKKDTNACKDYKEISGQKQLVDVSNINAPELIDTLNKHPELQLYSFKTSSTGWVARCNIFYKHLIIFTENYLINKGYNTGFIYASDTLRPQNISISLEPLISYQDAIKTAKQYINFDHTCISYRLGIYNTDISRRALKSYKLVWKIEGANHFPYAFIDAESKTVLMMDNGIRTGFID
ncbi:MAG: hypothetical protein H0W73_13785 [Bacteroidetes bacterium]|nr:hypothetical protein [Bacteroidota bacterium]